MTIFCYYCISPLSEGENRFLVDLSRLYDMSLGIPEIITNNLEPIDILPPMNICRKCYDRKGQQKVFEETQLRIFMYRAGYRDREYAKNMLKFFSGGERQKHKVL